MSVGPAALGNVLVQRLDAVLGTTMSAASANQVSGARPDAVSQPGNLDKPGSADGSNRDPRQGIQTGGARGDRPATVIDAKTAAALALAARGLVTSSDTTASAPTTLGTTARAILALLAQYPEAAPAVQGRAPLWTAPPLCATDRRAGPAGRPTRQPAGSPRTTHGRPRCRTGGSARACPHHRGGTGRGCRGQCRPRRRDTVHQPARAPSRIGRRRHRRQERRSHDPRHPGSWRAVGQDPGPGVTRRVAD